MTATGYRACLKAWAEARIDWGLGFLVAGLALFSVTTHLLPDQPAVEYWLWVDATPPAHTAREVQRL